VAAFIVIAVANVGIFEGVERYRRIPDGDLLEVTVTVTDPVMLTGPYTYTRYYHRGAELRAAVLRADHPEVATRVARTGRWCDLPM
jgi:hypothetical protein